MQFKILEDFQQNNPPPGKNPPEAAPEKPEPKEEPKRKIDVHRLKGLIDNIGYRLANDDKISTEEKIEGWVETLKWALPLIPDDEQHFKNQVRESINNPTERDFIERPPR